MKKLPIVLAALLIVALLVVSISCNGEQITPTAIPTPILSPTPTQEPLPIPTSAPVVTAVPTATATLTPKPTPKHTSTPVRTPILPPPPTPTPTSGSCCYDNYDCDFTQYCAKTVNNCSGCGICKPKPGACTQVNNPVCGCDGQTYTNAGCAAAAGVNVISAGECIYWIPLPIGGMLPTDYTIMCSLVDDGKTP